MAHSVEKLVLASAARTALVAATPIGVPFKTSLIAIQVIVTAIAVTPTLTFTVKNASGGTVLASAALSPGGAITYNFVIGVHAYPVTNVAAQAVPLEGMTFEVAVGDADSCTYSVQAQFFVED